MDGVCIYANSYLVVAHGAGVEDPEVLALDVEPELGGGGGAAAVVLLAVLADVLLLPILLLTTSTTCSSPALSFWTILSLISNDSI